MVLPVLNVVRSCMILDRENELRPYHQRKVSTALPATIADTESPNMKLIIPVGPKDANNLDLLVRSILHFGGVQQPVLIVSVPSQIDNSQKAVETLQTCCPDVSLIDTEDDFADGWFMGPNRMFHWTVTHMHETGNTEAFLWLEPDCCPLVKGWADRIEEDYRSGAKPYYGFVRATRFKDPQGVPYFVPGDNMLLGVAVYPPNMLADEELRPLFANLGIPVKTSHPPSPWDIYLRWRFFRRGVQESTLMHDKWCTINYRYDGKTIVCDADSDSPTGTAEGGFVPASAVLVHGCKDGSLQRLVTGETKPVPVSVPAVATAPKVQNQGDIAKVQAAIAEILKAGGKVRQGDVASKAGINSSDARIVLESLGHTIGKAGWVTLKVEEEL